MEMTANEHVAWTARMQTPVIFNHHTPLTINSTTIEHVNLNPIRSTRQAVANEERVLILTPVKDAAPYLSKYFDLLSELTYPHHLIDVAFLVSDSTDETLAVLASELDRVQKRPDKFHSAIVVEKDFDFHLSQDVKERHSFEAQGPRRKALGRARNYLLSAAMKPEHSWVYWRDVDIVESPKHILEDFIAHDRDVLVPSMFDLLALLCALQLCTVRTLCFWNSSTKTRQTFGSTATETVAILRVDVSHTLRPGSKASNCFSLYAPLY